MKEGGDEKSEKERKIKNNNKKKQNIQMFTVDFFY